MKTRKAVTIKIPEDLTFSDLGLTRSETGAVEFNWYVIERICEVNNLSIKLFTDHGEDNLATLMVNWYMDHKLKGGDADSVADELILETLVEDSFGQHFSLQTGRA